MTILTNFIQYIPTDPADRELMDNSGVLFLKSAENADWYKSQKLFKDDLLKIVFDSKTGTILATALDVTTLWPIGYSVADVDYDLEATPESLRDKVFQIRTGTIVDRTYSKAELRQQAEAKISKLRAKANVLITPLQYAKELDMISPEEEVYLRNLQRYVVLLSRVPSQEGYPTTIDWPILPTE